MPLRDEVPSPDPFEGLVFDDAFVAAASIKEALVVDRRPRRFPRWAGLTVQSLVAVAALVAVVALNRSANAERSVTASTVRPGSGATGYTATGGLPVPQPWNDPVPELNVQVGPDWLAVGPPGHP